MSILIPTIMAHSLADLRIKYAAVAPFVDEVQIDVMDGVFVLAKGWCEPNDIRVSSFVQLPFEMHLMVDKPERRISKWLETGAARLIVHVESTDQMSQILVEAQVFGTEIALGINVLTPLERLDPWLDRVKVVQMMGIKNVGHQGEPFAQEILPRIKVLKKRAPHVTIAVDGGVNEETIPLLRAAGVERFAVGSAIFQSEDVRSAIFGLQEAIKK